MNAFKNLPFFGQLAIAIVFAVGIGIGAYTLWPDLKSMKVEIGKKEGQLQELSAELDELTVLQARLPELEREINNLRAQLDQLKLIIPPVRDDSRLLQQIESAAKRSRLEIGRLQPQRLRRKEFYDEYPLSVDVTGNYHDIAKFFERMANLPRIYNVSGVKMRQARRSELSISANFTALTFIYREEPEGGAPPADEGQRGKKKKKKKRRR